MSRIGKLPINIPSGVTITVNPDNSVTVKGPKGELHQKVDADIKSKLRKAMWCCRVLPIRKGTDRCTAFTGP